MHVAPISMHDLKRSTKQIAPVPAFKISRTPFHHILRIKLTYECELETKRIIDTKSQSGVGMLLIYHRTTHHLTPVPHPTCTAYNLHLAHCRPTHREPHLTRRSSLLSWGNTCSSTTETHGNVLDLSQSHLPVWLWRRVGWGSGYVVREVG